MINKFKKLEKLDGEEITEVDRDVAKEFLKKFGGQKEEVEPERPKTSKSILNIRRITSNCKNSEEVILEREDIEEAELKTAQNFFPKSRGVSIGSSKKNSVAIEDKTNEFNIEELKGKYEEMNIQFEEIPVPTAKPKDTNRSGVNRDDSLKLENIKLKEENEFLKAKISSLEALIESQKNEIENFNSLFEFSSSKKISLGGGNDKDQYLLINEESSNKRIKR